MSETPQSSPLISVIICTYNRLDLLTQVLKTLVCQTMSTDLFEIIVVDNNSKDETRDVCSSIISENPDVNIRYVLEPKQGLSHARNRGWKEARGDYVAYADDDCKVPSEWLNIAKDVIDQVHPAAFGGPYYAFYNSPRSIWFKDEYCSHIQGYEARTLQKQEFLDGTNLFIQKVILESLNGFNPDLGMSGENIAYGEETALLMNIREKLSGAIIYYEPKLYVYHLVSQNKMKLSWNAKNCFISGIYASHVFIPKSIGKRDYIIKLIYGIVLIFVLLNDVIFMSIFRNRSKYPYIQNYLYEHSFKYIRGFGSSWGYIFRK